jgi:Flp pilus assembly pilin Flp
MKDAVLRITIRIQNAVARLADEAGQTVAEYALVLLVAAAIAGALLLWAKQSGKLDGFFDAVFDKLLGSVEPEPTPSP